MTKPSPAVLRRTLCALCALVVVHAIAGSGAPASSYVPDLGSLVGRPSSELRDVLERYMADRAVLQRRFDVRHSPSRRGKLRSFYADWRAALDGIDFDALGQEGRIDHILFRVHLEHRLRRMDREDRIFAETAPLVPFAGDITSLQEARRDLEAIDPEALARHLDGLAGAIGSAREAVEAGRKGGEPGGEDPAGAGGDVQPVTTTKVVAYRAAKIVDDLQRTLDDWFRYHDGYHPLFTWWVSEPYRRADEALKDYAEYLRKKVVGIQDGEDPPIVGDPAGREALLSDLGGEMIAYTPEELVRIAHRELAWCEREMLRASRDLGFGDDWQAALEHVKNLHVGPGEQPELIRDQALEAIAFLEERALLTIPPLARDVWRMSMMSPERQKIAPFFLGGEVIQVSFPTSSMSHEDKLMSMRGNNIHFARATVHHELIPGHHLQGFMNSRYNRHRRLFRTPFWTEGWALYWEMVLWDLDFARSPENRIGMLFWRMHRCARILFSLGFHLGTMTPEECIELLVERVGHERANATAEVRRSFEGSYPPLYQLAYMVGALEFRALRKELVTSGKMEERAFHDAVLELGTMPIEMVRAALTGQPLTPDYVPGWRFEGDPGE